MIISSRQHDFSKVYIESTNELELRSAIAGAISGGVPVDIFFTKDCGTSGFTITSPIPVVSGITRYHCLTPVMTHSGNIPDNDITFVGGTWFKGDGTFPCFQAQSTAGVALDVSKGSPDANFTTTGLREIVIENCGVQNFTKAISIGNHNQMGLLYSTIHDIWIKDCTDFGIDLVNFQHSEIYRIYTFSCIHGQRYASDVASAVLMPGNSKIHELFNQPGYTLTGVQQRKHRSLLFEATTGSILNELMCDRIQANLFNRSNTAYTCIAGGTGLVTLQSGKGAEMVIGMPIVVTNIGTNVNVSLGQTYFIKTISTDTISISLERGGAAITGVFTGAFAFTTYGYGCLEIIGTSTGGVNNSTFINLDLEGVSQGALSIEYASRCNFTIGELHSVPEKHIICRRSQPNHFLILQSFGCDIDGNSTQCYWTGSLIYSQVAGSINSITAYPSGYIRDSSTNIIGIALSQYHKSSINWQPSSGSGFLKPSLPFGSAFTPWPYSVGTIDASHGSTIVAYGAGATSVTLPTINSGGTGTDNTTWKVRIWNLRTGAFTINTVGGKLFNGLATKTSVVLAAQSATDTSWADIEIQRVNGVDLYFITTGIQVL